MEFGGIRYHSIKKIEILAYVYKPNSSDTRESLAIDII